jgi:hypothetical protein
MLLYIGIRAYISAYRLLSGCLTLWCVDGALELCDGDTSDLERVAKDAETKSAAALNAAVERRPSLPLSTVRVSPFYVLHLSLATQHHYSLHERTLPAMLPPRQLPYSMSNLVQVPVLPHRARISRPFPCTTSEAANPDRRRRGGGGVKGFGFVSVRVR